MNSINKILRKTPPEMGTQLLLLTRDLVVGWDLVQVSLSPIQPLSFRDMAVEPRHFPL